MATTVFTEKRIDNFCLSLVWFNEELQKLYMSSYCAVLYILFFLTLSDYARAQETFDPPDVPEVVVALKIKEPITVNGLLDEDAWQRAAVYAAFVQYEPFQGSPPTEPTEVRMLYDERFLYVGVFNALTGGKKALRVQNLQRDFDYDNNDLFGVAIDGFRDKRNGVVFQVNPYGAQRELLVLDGVTSNVDWDGLWRVRTHRTDSGWYAEMAIPWKTLRYPEGCSQMGIVFMRNIRSNNENVIFPAQPRAYAPYRMAYAAVLEDINPPPPSVNVLINPYLVINARNEKVGNRSFRETKSTAGGEVKWVVNPTTVIDVTYNTDFAQADVDRQVINLTRFSVLFPERRQFFLEGAEIYTNRAWSTLQPFFSRRIGLDEQGNLIPIEAGARLMHRSTKQTLGALAIRQRAHQNNTAANFLVTRYARNLSSQSRIGGMLTYRHDEADTSERVINNTMIAVDGFIRPGQKVNMYWIASGTRTRGRINDQGYAAATWAFYNTNDFYIGHIQAFISEAYNPRSGFVDDRNYVLSSPAITYKWRPHWRPRFVRQINPGVSALIYHRHSDWVFREGFINFRIVDIDFQNGGRMFCSVIPNWQNLFRPFFPIGIEIAQGRYDFLRYRFGYRSDFSRRLATEFSYTAGSYFDGRLGAFIYNLRISPGPHIACIMSYEYNQIRKLGVEQADRDTHLAGIDLRLALNPRLQLISFYQYNTSINRSVLNARLVWEYQPLSFLYLVINENRFDSIDPEHSLTVRAHHEQVIFKMTWLRQL